MVRRMVDMGGGVKWGERWVYGGESGGRRPVRTGAPSSCGPGAVGAVGRKEGIGGGRGFSFAVCRSLRGGRAWRRLGAVGRRGQGVGAEKSNWRCSKKVPPERCDKEGRTTVAAFRPWRGLPALNPHSLTAGTLWTPFSETQPLRPDFWPHPACFTLLFRGISPSKPAANRLSPLGRDPVLAPYPGSGAARFRHATFTTPIHCLFLGCRRFPPGSCRGRLLRPGPPRGRSGAEFVSFGGFPATNRNHKRRLPRNSPSV